MLVTRALLEGEARDGRGQRWWYFRNFNRRRGAFSALAMTAPAPASAAPWPAGRAAGRGFALRGLLRFAFAAVLRRRFP